MRKILFVLVLLLFSGIAYGQLSQFPDNFMKNEDFNAYIVVGREGSSTDVISQSLIGMAVNSYAGSMQEGINKLDDEVSLDTNLILIGNPCVNDLTAELLDNPEPCDKNFPAGKAYIRYHEDNGRKYVIVAGNSNKGTRKAAEYLADLDDLKGEEIELEVEGEFQTAKEDSKKESGNLGMPPEDKIAPPPPGIDETETKKDNPDAKDLNEKSENKSGSKTDKVVVVEENVFAKIINWFSSLFAR